MVAAAWAYCLKGGRRINLRWGIDSAHFEVYRRGYHKAIGSSAQPWAAAPAKAHATQGRARCARLSGQTSEVLEHDWSPRQESNLYLALRRRLFYPLNYGERIV